MTKKETKQKHATKEEVKEALNDEFEKSVDKECAEQLERVLKEHGRALQPFLAYTELATIPRVRLVRQEANGEEE